MKRESKRLWVSMGLFGATIVAPFFVLIPLVIAWMNRVIDGPVFEQTIVHSLGMLLIGFGFYLAGYILWDLTVPGAGTPAPYLPPRKFIQQGLYGNSRNPMYLGYFLVVWGVFLLLGVWLLVGYAVVFMLAFHGYVIWFEEPELKRRFGSMYEEYQEQVPRWL